MHEVNGVVARAKGAAPTVERILIPDPGPGEVLIDVHTCGVCRTDEHYVTGRVGGDYPYLLGHEATGTVAAVGPGEARLSVGDLVVLNWRAVCGECRACHRGEPWYCFATHNAAQKMTLADGTPLTAALGIGAFAEKTLVAAGQATSVDPSLAREQYAAVGLLGCGVMSGIGSAVRTGEARKGDAVAVLGTGGVGMGAIAGARMAGATTIIAIGRTDAKLGTARRLGATHTVNASRDDVVAEVRRLTGGFGADLVIDAVGARETFLQALEARDHAGRMVLVGVPEPGARVELRIDEFFGRGGSIKPSWYGDTLPNRDIPAVVAEYLLGRIDLDAFVSERIRLDEVGEAFERMNCGEVLRSVVEVDAAVPRA